MAPRGTRRDGDTRRHPTPPPDAVTKPAHGAPQRDHLRQLRQRRPAGGHRHSNRAANRNISRRRAGSGRAAGGGGQGGGGGGAPVMKPAEDCP